MSGSDLRTGLAPKLTAVLVGLLPVGPAFGQDLAQHQVFTFVGQGLTAGLGAAVTPLGDLDGDGRTDFAVGEPGPLSGSDGRVLVLDGAAGSELWSVEGPPLTWGASARFGASLAALPDLDGDGLFELAVGAPRDDGAGLDAGAVQIHAGADGALLHRFEGLPGETLGAALARADLDGDGLDDLVAGGPGGDAVVAWSSAWLRSIVAGEAPTGPEVLLVGTGSGRFGASVVGLHDLDGDGFDEVAVGAPADLGAAGPFAGAVEIVSGADGLLLARLEGIVPGEAFGSALAALPSVDGDGTDELAVGAPRAGVQGQGAVRVFRGASLAGAGTPETWLEALGSGPGDGLGVALAPVADLSGDGLAELAVSAPAGGASAGEGSVRVLSGADGALLFTVDGDGPGAIPGLGVAAFDLADDAAPELLVGAPLHGDGEAGRLRVLSIAPRGLAADRHRISVDTGGVCRLSIDAGAALAGQLYVTLGSFTGTSPGLPTAAGLLPVNFDAYSLYSLSNPPDLVSFNGFLDGAGRAQAEVVIPAGASPNLVKFLLHYACYTVDLASPGFPVASVTNAVPLGFDVDDCTAAGPEGDCNGNGVLDLCEIADGTLLDCDGNGVPDACQLSEPGADLDGDGVLDACRTIVHVDSAATGAGDGSSWANAYTDLRVALAGAPDFAELWVAAGTYRPWPNVENDAASFDLRAGLALFGGFSGVETARDQRDWEAFPTVLSGDLAGDDGLPGGSTVENSWNVVSVPEGVGPTARLDGFRIEGGNADEIAGCDVFAIYFASCRGGGLYCFGSPVVRHCTFRSNFGGHHGGAVFTYGSPTFVECVFEQNAALRGGAVYTDVGARPRFVNCVVRSNDALEGGGLYGVGSGEDGPELVNSLVVGNRAADAGAGILVVGARAVVVQSTLAGNSSQGPGGGLYGTEGGSAVMSNSVLWGNLATAGSLQAQQLDGQSASIQYTCVEGGTSGLGGVGNLSANPLFLDLFGPDGLAGTADDDLRLAPGSPCRDAGSTPLVPPDFGDLDLDGDALEPLPLDLDGNPRVVDDPAAANAGVPGPSGAVVDLGPLEG